MAARAHRGPVRAPRALLAGVVLGVCLAAAAPVRSQDMPAPSPDSPAALPPQGGIGNSFLPFRLSLRLGGGGFSGSLKDFILRVLRGRVRPMRVKDITAAVRKAGYATKNRTLDKSVGNALAATPQIVKVARGQYRLRG